MNANSSNFVIRTASGLILSRQKYHNVALEVHVRTLQNKVNKYIVDMRNPDGIRITFFKKKRLPCCMLSSRTKFAIKNITKCCGVVLSGRRPDYVYQQIKYRVRHEPYKHLYYHHYHDYIKHDYDHKTKV